MKHFSRFLVLVALIFSAGCAGHYDSTLHKIGNTNYMIREARQAGANKHAEDPFVEAMKLQKQAIDAHKQHQLPKATDLTTQAYGLAKQARDQSLAATGKKF